MTESGLRQIFVYLLAGALIGPAVLGYIGTDGASHHVMHVGVVVMLFLIGLELRPTRLWEMRGSVLGLGGLQVAVTALAILLAALAGGSDWRTGLAAGLILAMSSTAIVLQSLGEKGLLKTPGGESCFSRTLTSLGFPADRAARAAKLFRDHDEAALPSLAAVFDGDHELYVSTARRHIQNLTNVFRADAKRR